ncbi:MAG: META domain-containing protein [Chloroflexota bacterium]|nr:META domain-containing protein [Chloroflexota bacterium]
MHKPTRAGPLGLCSGLLLLCVALFLGVPSAWAADCKFVLGFATLKALIDEAEGPEKVGQCLENEHFNPEKGAALQRTTGGLLVWRKADNRTTFTDGYRTWINGPYGLQVRLNTEHFDWEVPAALKLEALKNAEYLSDWPTGGKATLTDGMFFEPYEPGSASGIYLFLSEDVAYGDLNSDGATDAIVILDASGGGSGTFRYLAAVVNKGGQPRHVASALLGDRVRIESLAIQAGRIVVELIGHGPGDGACCPTQEQTLAFQLAGDTLEGVPLTLQQLKNAEYQSEFPTGGKARLTDGTFFEPYEPGSASGVRLTLSEHVAFGDLNDDGDADAAVVLIADPGGSGTFRHVAAVINEGGEPRHVASAFLGDRVKVESLAIQDGEIVVQLIGHGPEDPLCCPTQQVRRAFQLVGSMLKESPSIVDVLWHWERFEDTRGSSWDITVADPQKYTLRLLPGGTFQVKADCNTGSGAYKLSRGSISLDLRVLTRAACPPESLSQTYLTRLGEVVTYVLHEGKLVLNLKIDGGNMVFAKGGAAPQS